MRYRLLSVAAEDLAAAVEFYERQSAGLGADFLDEFEAAIQRVCSCPHAWTPVSANQRRCLFRRFPFAILYTADRRAEGGTG
jgi:hypothetical protein